MDTILPRAVVRKLVLRVTHNSLGALDPDTVFIAVSPDNRHVAYVVGRAGKLFVVCDGAKQREYDWIAQETPLFSPDSRRWAYVAKTQIGNVRTRQAMDYVVVDGVESEYYDGTNEGTPIFSPDSQRVAYGASLHNAVFALLDGKKESGYKAIESLTFSPDSSQLAYVALAPVSGFMGLRRNHAFRTVVNGVEGKPYFDIA
jgi:hypothetical protein